MFRRSSPGDTLHVTAVPGTHQSSRIFPAIGFWVCFVGDVGRRGATSSHVKNLTAQTWRSARGWSLGIDPTASTATHSSFITRCRLHLYVYVYVCLCVCASVCLCMCVCVCVCVQLFCLWGSKYCCHSRTAKNLFFIIWLIDHIVLMINLDQVDSLTILLILSLLCPQEACKVLWWVCLSVRSHNSKTA